MITVGHQRGRYCRSRAISRGFAGDGSFQPGEMSRPCCIQGNGEGTGGKVQERPLTQLRVPLSLPTVRLKPAINHRLGPTVSPFGKHKGKHIKHREAHALCGCVMQQGFSAHGGPPPNAPRGVSKLGRGVKAHLLNAVHLTSVPIEPAAIHLERGAPSPLPSTSTDTPAKMGPLPLAHMH